MYIQQLFTGCLAEMAYYIESNGEAAIIDPLRETTPYIEMAKDRNAKIKFIFLTHFHADFVSGHLDLAKETGATIVFGPNAKTAFDFHQGKDEELFELGDIKIKLLHTPGHTMESSSYLLIDNKGNTPYIFTGDTLFIGDVGRPDLAVKSDLTEADLAAHLFDSLRNKIMSLPDTTIVYPAHGAGSACGKNMSKETYDTLGNQKATNYTLRADMTKEEFIKEVTTGLTTPPQYFPKNVAMNKGINKSYDEILADANTPLSVEEFKTILSNENSLIIDVRHENDFVKSHIPGSLFFGLDGGFAPWVGTLIEDLNTSILLITPKGREEETITRLSRVGYDNVKGYLKGGIKTWIAAGENVASIDSISAETFAEEFAKKPCSVLDVRKESEFYSEHIIHDDVTNSSLDKLMKEYPQLDKNKTYYTHCAGGYRSVIALSILKAKGFNKLINIEGGFNKIKEYSTVQTSPYVCPTTML
ncbi:MAG: MBL fold metallo-hydrolase [Vicingus serpentipes]|nr:MBL fold metallo-hydrolase [Vicingus serpentipes]